MVSVLSILSLSFVFSVSADMGPKPSTTIKIIGLNQPYCFDLLVKTNEEYVLELNEEEVVYRTNIFYYRDDYPDELNGFYDRDGFASYSLYRGMPRPINQSEDNTFVLSYAPPNVFKIALVLDSGELIVSNIINKSIFDATFIYDLSLFSLLDSESEVIEGVIIYYVDIDVAEVIPYGVIVLQIILTLTATLIIELFILFVFRYKNKNSYKLALKVNIFTQLILYTTMSLVYLFFGFFEYFFILFIGEVIVISLEVTLFSKFLKEKSKLIAVVYAIIANVSSLLIGHYLLIFISRI